MRARVWLPEVGVFSAIDELAFHSSRTTLWGWPGQSPVRWSDPSGRCPACIVAIGAVIVVGAVLATDAPHQLTSSEVQTAQVGVAVMTGGMLAGAYGGAAVAVPAVGASELGAGGVAGKLTSDQIRQLSPTGAQRNLINQFFRSGTASSELTNETLENYARLAKNALEDPDKSTARAVAEQTRRLELIDQLLRSREATSCGQ